MPTVIFTKAVMPDELAEEWLRHLRDFDTMHPQCHFTCVSSTTLPTDMVERILHTIDPPFDTVTVVPFPKEPKQ